MKYAIEIEKIKGTNLWKAKNFNTLVFDKNGLNKMSFLDKDIQEKEIKEWRQKYCNEKFNRERLEFLVKEQECRLEKIKKQLIDEIKKNTNQKGNIKWTHTSSN